ncbi:hypothetical protein ASC74_07210 [Pseudomonas sp. Root329]|jgi:hypothetical protein|uniref:hypothetical protein n=1 Tax=Pseudomonas sp. Root329 TaxID=1736515 RepID=UPI0006F64905|nr:hypothetical protein [Pseudomonas sp. Root329]KQV12891.1 hypothetical protein ASC74_07210 [Pseudomonas sp. Root329]
MSEQNITGTPPDNIEHQTDAEGVPLKNADETNTLTRKTRSIDSENSADRKRGTGGLDSLGGGRLP